MSSSRCRLHAMSSPSGAWHDADKRRLAQPHTCSLASWQMPDRLLHTGPRDIDCKLLVTGPCRAEQINRHGLIHAQVCGRVTCGRATLTRSIFSFTVAVFLNALLDSGLRPACRAYRWLALTQANSNYRSIESDYDYANDFYAECIAVALHETS